MGIGNKCFEILEAKRAKAADTSRDFPSGGNGAAAPVPDSAVEGDDDEDEEWQSESEGEGDEEDGEEDEEEDGDGDDDTESELSDDVAKGKDGEEGFRLREILFYDDKIAIFKARHGML